jgi:hypothetical protein
MASTGIAPDSRGDVDCRFSVVIVLEPAAGSSGVDKGEVFRIGGKSGTVPSVMGAFERMGVWRLRATRPCMGVLGAGIGTEDVDCMRARNARISLSRSAYREISHVI